MLNTKGDLSESHPSSPEYKIVPLKMLSTFTAADEQWFKYKSTVWLTNWNQRFWATYLGIVTTGSLGSSIDLLGIIYSNEESHVKMQRDSVNLMRWWMDAYNELHDKIINDQVIATIPRQCT